MELSSRQETLLALIIREYVDSASAVSSNGIREKYKLPYSPATIRNEMAELTEQGFVRQPHTSAGRVPTEEGYRYFVQQLIGEVELPRAEQNTISHQFHQTRGDVNLSLRLAASVISQHGRGAALVTAPRNTQSALFKHVEIIATHGRQVLLIVVLVGGEIRQQILTLAEPVPQMQLSEAATRLNTAFLNLDSESINLAGARYPVFDQEITRMIADIMNRDNAPDSGQIMFEGMSRVLAEPEFADTHTARQTQKALEEHTFLQQFLSRTLSTNNVGSVQVIIGGEADWEEIKDCSMVLARYGVNNIATGTLGVVGPTRMAYGRAISTVRYVAELMTDLVNETYGDS